MLSTLNVPHKLKTLQIYACAANCIVVLPFFGTASDKQKQKKCVEM